MKQGGHDERPCQALLWRRRKDQKGKVLLQGRSLGTSLFASPAAGVGTPTAMQLWKGKDITVFIWLDVVWVIKGSGFFNGRRHSFYP